MGLQCRVRVRVRVSVRVTVRVTVRIRGYTYWDVVIGSACPWTVPGKGERERLRVCVGVQGKG